MAVTEEVWGCSRQLQGERWILLSGRLVRVSRGTKRYYIDTHLTSLEEEVYPLRRITKCAHVDRPIIFSKQLRGEHKSSLPCTYLSCLRAILC
jgi:hypothetical protein